jgi:hypothetical protein
MQRPWSLWARGNSVRCRVHTTAPDGVRSHDGKAVVTQDDRAEMQLQVNRQHDDSPVYVHLVDEDGQVVSTWLLTFAQSVATAKRTPCGVRLSLEELRFSRSGSA